MRLSENFGRSNPATTSHADLVFGSDLTQPDRAKVQTQAIVDLEETANFMDLEFAA